MAFRFIHTADIHLDSPLKSLAMRNEELADIVANATRQVLERIVTLCIDEKVDALLIAGDLYDGEQTSMKTARFLASQMRMLDDAGISVFIIRGNHDAQSKITNELTFPKCVHVFGSKSESVVFESSNNDGSALERSVVIHGTSFKKPHAPDSLLPLYKQPDPNAINIGMMHTSLDGQSGHDLYAPCSLSSLHGHGFDYWALGHIHKRAVYKNDTCTVVMPGIPQGRDIGESGHKTVTLVNISDSGEIDIDERFLAVAQFEEVKVALNRVEEWSELQNLIMNEIESAAGNCDAEHLVARVELDGHTSLAWTIKRDADRLKEEILSRLEEEENLWLDKLVINCELPKEDAELSDSEDSPHRELHKLMLKEIKDSDSFKADAMQAFNDLLGALPPGVRDSFGKNEEEIQKRLIELANSGSELVSAALQPKLESDNDAN